MLSSLGRRAGFLARGRRASSAGGRLLLRIDVVPTRLAVVAGRARSVVGSASRSSSAAAAGRTRPDNGRGGDDHDANGGFGAFIDRRNRGGRASPSSTAGGEHEEDWLDSTTAADDRHDFGEYDGGGELREWHAAKEEEMRRLSSDVEGAVGSAVEDEGDVVSVLSLMEELNAFSSSITSELHSMHDFRRRNMQYPPSNFMTEITCRAAEMAEGLLAHLLGGGASSSPSSSSSSSSLTPEREVSAYGLAMAAWSRAYHSQSGDRCEEVLERYGERFGGDMNHAPGLDAYKTVLAAHLRSCSSTSFGAVLNNNKGGWSSPGEKALDLLTLLSNVHAGGDMFLKPDMELYCLTVAAIRNTLLDWQSRRRFQSRELRSLEEKLAVGLLGALERMETSLDGMVKKDRKKGDGPPLSLRQWHRAIGAYADGLAIAASIPMKNNKQIVDKLLKKMENFISENSGNIILSIDDDLLNDIDVQKLLEEIQWSVEAAYTSALSSGLIISKETCYFADFNGALDNAMSSEEIFQRMRNRAQESPSDEQFLFPLPTPENYRALIKCWCECLRIRYSNPKSNHHMANLAELPHLKAASLLRQLEIQTAGKPIDGSIYVDVIWAWGQVLGWPAIYRDQNDYFFAANAVDLILKRAMSQYANEIVYFPWRMTVTKMFNMAFRLHSKIFKGGDKVVKRSLKLLDEMEHWYKQSDGAIAQADDFTFALILKTISNSGLQSSASNAEAVIQKMNSFGLTPREKHYLGLIRAHARVGQSDVSDPRKAEAVLQGVKEIYNQNKSVKPTTLMYSACISAYGGSEKYNSTSKVMELFEELKTLHEKTNDEAFRPDSMLYGAVIDAISKARNKNSASLHQAKNLLEKMEHSQDTGETETGPNRYAYTNLLRAINQTNMEDGATLAEELIQRMDSRSRRLNDVSIRPDTQTYTALIQSFSSSSQVYAVERAQKWFQHMERSGCRPNKVTCTALINCWRKSERVEAGEEAEKILSMMEKRSEEGDLEMKPDAFVYASAIDAWARSSSPDKAARAWSIYQRMKTQYFKGNMDSKPNNIIMTSIIKACGFTQGRKEDKHRALIVLLECMGELKSTNVICPTPLTYRSLLNATRALVDDNARRRPISATIFETCCRNGQLDTTVLEALEKTQPDLYLKLPSDIPPKWRRHVSKENQN